MLLSCINSEKIVTSISSVSSLPQTLKAIVTISQFSTKVSHFVANVVYFAQIDGVPQDELVKTERAIFGIEDIFVDFIPFLKGVQGAKITPDVPVISNLIKQEPGNVSTTPVIKKEPDVHEVINGLDRDTMSIPPLSSNESTPSPFIEACDISASLRKETKRQTRIKKNAPNDDTSFILLGLNEDEFLIDEEENAASEEDDPNDVDYSPDVDELKERHNLLKSRAVVEEKPAAAHNEAVDASIESISKHHPRPSRSRKGQCQISNLRLRQHRKTTTTKNQRLKQKQEDLNDHSKNDKNKADCSPSINGIEKRSEVGNEEHGDYENAIKNVTSEPQRCQRGQREKRETQKKSKKKWPNKLVRDYKELAVGSCYLCQLPLALPKAVDHIRDNHPDMIENIFKCPVCQKKTLSLEYHLRVHHGPKRNECEICHKTFSAIGTLKRHRKLIHFPDENDFLCEGANGCGKRFLTAAELAHHRRKMHEGESKPFVCDLCGATFQNHERLCTHLIKVHQVMQGTHECPQCHKKFANKAHLSAHMVVHSTARDFPCNICGKTFARATNLKQHQISHQPPRHECNICGKRFLYRAAGLGTHLRQVHGVDFKGSVPN